MHTRIDGIDGVPFTGESDPQCFSGCDIGEIHPAHSQASIALRPRWKGTGGPVESSIREAQDARNSSTSGNPPGFRLCAKIDFPRHSQTPYHAAALVPQHHGPCSGPAGPNAPRLQSSARRGGHRQGVREDRPFDWVSSASCCIKEPHGSALPVLPGSTGVPRPREAFAAILVEPNVNRFCAPLIRVTSPTQAGTCPVPKRISWSTCKGASKGWDGL